MSGGIEVKKPVRFFFFFGLFLAFVLLGVRACNERRTLEEVAEVEKILNENERALVPSKKDLAQDTPEGKELNVSNSGELEAFESEAPKKSKLPQKTKVKVKKNKAQAVINVKPKPSENKKKTTQSLQDSQRTKLTKKTDSKPPQKPAAKSSSADVKPKMKILVSGIGYTLDSISKAKLKGAVKLNSKPNKVKVLLFSKDPQKRSMVIKRAELKSALIRAGLSTRVDVNFETVDKSGYAEVLFF